MKITERTGAVRLTVHVQPRASQSAVVGEHGDALKIRLAAPPVDGAANEELRRFLAGLLGVAMARVEIAGGAAARRKVVQIEGVSAHDVVTAITRALQK